MKKLFLFLLLAIPFSLFAQKMGVVDEHVITETPEYADMEKALDEMSEKYKAEYEKLQSDMDKKITEFQALNTMSDLPENIRLLRMQEIQELNARVQQFRNAAATDIERHRAEMLKPLEERLDAAIKAVAEEEGLTVVYRKSAVAYTSANVIDITSYVRTRLLCY